MIPALLACALACLVWAAINEHIGDRKYQRRRSAAAREEDDFERERLGWTRVGDTWVTDTLLGDSGGNGFTPEELELIRQSRAIKRPTRTRNRERKASREEQHARYIDCGPAAWDDR